MEIDYHFYVGIGFGAKMIDGGSGWLVILPFVLITIE